MFKGTQKSDITDQHDRYPLLDTSHSTTAASIHDRPLRIGSSVTPYRLLNIVVLLGLGQSFAAGNLDWAGGLFATVTLYYVATYDGEKGPPWTNRFFRTDLSRPTFVKKILLRRSIFALGKTRSGFRGVSIDAPQSSMRCWARAHML
ncbi:hypothetical protein FIBSPDRAFT_364684 [Athelia psychrophila]|uniref:Uncharacterized protein n=1 Tax=Athelia psychrophila TaxID=1759441 RepID=A0A167VLB4_9AGAM|nr:hypothetical protein FIBSPDRAFT_364684 [Fibularhizoctonia sp. CBS 109695]